MGDAQYTNRSADASLCILGTEQPNSPSSICVSLPASKLIPQWSFVLAEASVAMADTCTPPTGGKPFSFGLEPKVLSAVVLVLASTPLLLVLMVPIVITRTGRFLGFTLRKKTEGRRAHLVSLMEEDDKRYRKENVSPKSSSSEEFEAVEGADTKPATKGDQTQKNWGGIIGFFHPFW